ncbi:hypothetical protein LQE88_04940 [Acidaminococcus sp. NSJ-142]|nr:MULTISPECIES: hypothetical protein [Acidaminococcus]MCD2435335.1 hypothetical protein [Acidaminococcus hominis]MCH4096697.1 hypothetical protein [Acidaminococcus provencensis]
MKETIWLAAAASLAKHLKKRNPDKIIVGIFLFVQQAAAGNTCKEEQS